MAAADICDYVFVVNGRKAGANGRNGDRTRWCLPLQTLWLLGGSQWDWQISQQRRRVSIRSKHYKFAAAFKDCQGRPALDHSSLALRCSIRQQSPAQ
jgi:hypothetical protein